MNKKNRIICFYGGFFDKTGVGKTTAAHILVNKFDFHLCHITSNVENFAKKIANWDGKKDNEGIKILNKICIYGKNINPNYWLNMAMASIPPQKSKIVFDDVWFEEEYKAIRNIGGVFVLVERTGFDQPNWEFLPDFKICNDGTINNFEKKVCDLVQKVL